MRNDQDKGKSNGVSNEVNILINSFIEARRENRIDKSNEVNAATGNDVGIELLNRISTDINRIPPEEHLKF